MKKVLINILCVLFIFVGMNISIQAEEKGYPAPTEPEERYRSSTIKSGMREEIIKELTFRGLQINKPIKKGKVKSDIANKLHVFQGGCTDGVYYYVALIENNTGGVIAKYNASNMVLVDVSRVFNVDEIHHANDMTYNPNGLTSNMKNGVIVVAHNAGAADKVSFIDPVTLEFAYNEKDEHTISLNRDVHGIAYNKEKNQYVTGLSGGNNGFVFYDDNFKEISGPYYHTFKDADQFSHQGIDYSDGYIYFVTSGIKRYHGTNFIYRYRWDSPTRQGERIPLYDTSYEIENMVNIGGSLYTTHYNSSEGYMYKISLEKGKSFIIRYEDTAGALGSMSDTIVNTGISTTIPNSKFRKLGYIVDSWSATRASDGKGYYSNSNESERGWYSTKPSGWEFFPYKSGGTVSQTSSQNGDLVTFSTNWRRNKFTIQYDGGSEAAGSMPNTVVQYGISATIPGSKFRRLGYIVDSWAAHRKSDNKWYYYNPKSTGDRGWYVSGSQPSGWTKFPYKSGGTVSATSSVDGDIITFHANWRKNVFYIRYNSGGGTGSMPDTKVTYGVSTKIPANGFKKSGKTFDYWFAKRKFDGKGYYCSQNESERGWYTTKPSGWKEFPYKSGGTVSATSSADGDIVTFTARWK